MQLHYGTTVWQLMDEAPPTFPPLNRDAEADVIVVGAGISGATVAVFLARAGMKMIVVDRAQPVRGSTLACTALVQYELDVPLMKLREMIGRSNADADYLACYGVLQSFPEFAASLAAANAIQPRPSLYVAGNQLGGDDMREEAAARASLKIDATYLDEKSLAADFGLHRAGGAIRSDTAFAADPVLLTGACLREVIRLGGQIFGDTEIVSHETTGAGIVASTGNDGVVIRARHIVYAVGYDAANTLGLNLGSRSVTYALATPPGHVEPWPKSAMIWEASTPYFYVRTTADGRICLGGADEPDARMTGAQHLREKANGLVRAFAALCPNVKLEIETAWAGEFVTTRDGLPYVGGINGDSNATYVLTYSGNGILFSYLAGEVVRDRLLGRENSMADVVGLHRCALPLPRTRGRGPG